MLTFDELNERADELRRNPTEAEAIFTERLRRDRFLRSLGFQVIRMRNRRVRRFRLQVLINRPRLPLTRFLQAVEDGAAKRERAPASAERSYHRLDSIDDLKAVGKLRLAQDATKALPAITSLYRPKEG